MSKHEALIERLRYFDRLACNDAIDALEAQAREIEGMQAARLAYASEFPPDGEGEPVVGSIHQNIRAMKAEIEGLQAQLAATAKSAFEAMPHDIPRRMKRKICVETGWSMSMVSRAYIELRAAFTGEKYTANEDLDAAMSEIEGLRNEVDALSQDAACFRFWVREAAQSPCDMAKLIMRCVTEQDYRDVIMPIALAADKAIDAAKGASQ